MCSFYIMIWYNDELSICKQEHASPIHQSERFTRRTTKQKSVRRVPPRQYWYLLMIDLP